jgi:hypothetical protein
MEIRVEQLLQQNQELVITKEKLKEKLKQAEENLNHQIKVTKNLELVLERLQNGMFQIISRNNLNFILLKFTFVVEI